MAEENKHIKIRFTHNKYRKKFEPTIEYKPKISEYWKSLYIAMFRKWRN